jgi:hypothetical protein
VFLNFKKKKKNNVSGEKFAKSERSHGERQNEGKCTVGISNFDHIFRKLCSDFVLVLFC